jgi:signal transduction histidine kinase
VESLVADGRDFPPSGSVVVPPLTHDLQIDYTAPSFITPQKVLFRYKLEGFDKDWNDAGTRRQAFYTQLPPGKYRFRVSASNSDGVWNPNGASLDFAVAPAYYQTLGFRILSALCVALLVWLIFRMRVHTLTERIRLREAARASERERIARQIHDTFLQSVQAFLLRFSVVAEAVAKDHPAQPLLKELVQLSDGVVAEVRGGIHELRESHTPQGNLVDELAASGKTMAAGKPVVLSVAVTGQVRELAADAYENVRAIAEEAMRNAVTHAEARSIQVELHYSNTGLRLSVCDDGRGIDERILQHGLADHWGLVGMRERASTMRARLTVSSRPGAGIGLKLVVPAEVAFAFGARRG